MITYRVLGLLLALGNASTPLLGQVPESAFIAIDQDSLHYVDFGGSGLPVIFIHAADRGADTWIDFAPRFTDSHRVLAATARGVPPSTGEAGPTETRAKDLVALMDSLGIDRAVFAGNSSPASDMTFLAEHHPERVVGLIYLANAPFVAGLEDSDPTGAFDLALRATQPPQPFPYRPDYLDNPERRIDVPALTFVSESGTRGMESQPFSLRVARIVAERGADWIPDPEARAFFERLVADDQLRAEVAGAWEDSVAPAIVRNERDFRRAFGDNLRVVELPIPLVTGYEYLNQPDLIASHIQGFLGTLTDQ